jgi:hypothetical protein
MSDQPKWFTLRGEQYQCDGVCWWKMKSSETLSEPCSQPFRVGDRVKVVRALNSSLIGQTFVIDRVTGVDTWGNGCWIPLQNLEPAAQEPATQTPDVSHESQNDDMDGWETYEPVAGEPYSPGTEFQHKYGGQWRKQIEGFRHGHTSVDGSFIYRRPIQKPVDDMEEVRRKIADSAAVVDTWPEWKQRILSVFRPKPVEPAHKPLDVYLPEIERKVVLASKDRPELLDWWRDAKAELAIEAGKRIGGGM